VLADLRDEGTTVLVVDQMASMTLGVADRAYVLQQGTVVRSGPAAEIAGDAALEAAYLGGGAEAVEDGRKGRGTMSGKLDLVLRQARIAGAEDTLVDIAINRGRIADIRPRIDTDAREEQVGGRIVLPGFVESHIHLDKSCLLERCGCTRTLDEAIGAVAAAKRDFTVEDVHARGRARWRSASSRAPRGCAPMSRSTPGSACAGSRRSAGSRRISPGRSMCRFASFPRRGC
jgi:hypothetical protein